MCGVSMLRMRLPPRSRTVSAPSGSGARSARSLIETMQPIAVCATFASGAAARKRFIEPHSSDSRWPNVIHRSLSSGVTVATAALTEGNIARGPVWNNNGWSASTRNWLNVKPVGPMSETKVDRRKMRSAISSTWVSMTCVSLQRKRIAEDTGAGQATGENADELHGVDVDMFAVDALTELATGGPLEHKLGKVAVDLRPFRDDVGDEPSGVIGGAGA